MKNREFRSDRLGKIARTIVNIVAIFTLFFGTLGILRLDETNKYYMDGFDKCTKDGGTMQTCGFYIDLMNENEERT